LFKNASFEANTWKQESGNNLQLEKLHNGELQDFFDQIKPAV
jgi:hypothetical protein